MTLLTRVQAAVSTPFPQVDDGSEMGVIADGIDLLLSFPMMEASPSTTAIAESQRQIRMNGKVNNTVMF